MEQFQIDANEQFFTNVIRVLHEGGLWGWISEGEALRKVGDKLVGSQAAINKVERIVSEDYFKKHFEILKNNS